MKMQSTRLPAGPLKRIWVNKQHLPQFGGGDCHSPVWEVEVVLGEGEGEGDEGQQHIRRRGYRVAMRGEGACLYLPGANADGPHAWVETTAEIVIYSAVEEATT